MRKAFAAFAANDPEALEALLAPDFAAHGLPPELGSGPAAFTAVMALMHAGLSGCRYEIDDLVADGDRVTARYTVRARHTGELFGVPASGRSVTMTGTETYRLAGGRIVGYRGEADMSDLFAAGGQQTA